MEYDGNSMNFIRGCFWLFSYYLLLTTAFNIAELKFNLFF